MVKDAEIGNGMISGYKRKEDFQSFYHLGTSNNSITNIIY